MKAKTKLSPVIIGATVVIIIALVIMLIQVMPKGEKVKPAAVNKVAVYLDDENYKINSDDTVVIPAGRPRVPQVMCDDPNVEIYQAYFSDDQQAATATVRVNGEDRNIKFIKDNSLGLEFQYDDRIQWSGNIPNATYESSNPKVAKVTLSGQIIITGVSDEPVTLTASNGVEKEEFTITRTVKAPISVYLLTGQSNAAYYFADPATSSKTKKGTGYVFDASSGVYSIQSMNNDDDSQARGNIEAGIVKSLYDDMGEKVLIINTGLSGEKIDTFEPGNPSFDYSKNAWESVQYIFDTEWFQTRFEPRVRSYIWVQGESDDWKSPEGYMESFLKFHNMMRSDNYGFDYAFISQIVPRFFRPNDAQERLAQGYEDIFMATRVTNDFSTKTGELREDNLHYTQKGDNLAGEDIGHNIAFVYKGLGNALVEGEKE